MIAFDFDDVIVDCISILRLVLRRDFNIDIVNISEYNLSLPINKKIYLPCCINNFTNAMPPLPGAKEAINLILEKNFPVIFITARNYDTKKETINWIKNNLEIDNFSLVHKTSPEEKAKYIKYSKIEYFVEDRLLTANLVSQLDSIKNVFLINRPWNLNRQICDKVIRVDSVLDAVNFFLSKTNKE